jgi:ribosomal protein S18 acetylase RimI-like enzyme
MSIVLREARLEDAKAITELVNLAYRVEDFFISGDRTDLAEVEELLAHHSFIVAENAAEIVGCVEVRVEGERGYFGMLSTHPRRQATGIGRALLQAAENFCREAGCVRMDLVVVNLRDELPPFYQRFGYRVVGTEPFPVPEKTKLDCHFIVMSKELTAAVPHSVEAAH